MTEKFRIAILDAVPRIYWTEDKGITDGQMFYELLAPLSTETEFDIFYACEGHLPERTEEYDGYLISGSPASANDNLSWIDELSNFIIRADSKNRRIVACGFGHQLVAKTFGGKVGRNENSWMIGNYPIQIKRKFGWMEPGMISTNLFHFNRERVTRLPDAAISFADSDEYSDFAFTLGDNILCLQGQPEQPLHAMNSFLESVKPRLLPDELTLAREMIDDGEPDAHIWAQWMMRFFPLLNRNLKKPRELP